MQGTTWHMTCASWNRLWEARKGLGNAAGTKVWREDYGWLLPRPIGPQRSDLLPQLGRHRSNHVACVVSASPEQRGAEPLCRRDDGRRIGRAGAEAVQVVDMFQVHAAGDLGPQRVVLGPQRGAYAARPAGCAGSVSFSARSAGSVAFAASSDSIFAAMPARTRRSTRIYPVDSVGSIL